MPETVIVALVTGGLVFLSGAAATLGQIFGPSWQESRRQKREAETQAQAARVEKAMEFLEAVASMAHHDGPRRARIARIRFLGALRAEDLTPELLEFTDDLLDPQRRASSGYVERAADDLIGWLAGTKKASELRVGL